MCNLKLAMSEIISGIGSMIWRGYREDIQWTAGGF